MPLSYQQKIQSVPGVREVMVNQWFGGVYKEPKKPSSRGSESSRRDSLPCTPNSRCPTTRRKRSFRSGRPCVVGRALADRFGFKLGDRITLVGDIFPVDLELRVRAIYDSDQNNEALFFNIITLPLRRTAGRSPRFRGIVLHPRRQTQIRFACVATNRRDVSQLSHSDPHRDRAGFPTWLPFVPG